MPTATKPKINCRRLLKLADFLDNLPMAKFSFGDVRRETACGTVGCAIGWCPNVFPELCFAGENGVEAIGRPVRDATGMDWIDTGAKLFGMSTKDADGLFSPNMNSPAGDGELYSNATPRQVAERIRTFVTWHKAGRK